MASIRTWSTSAASNNQATPDGFPEGQSPSSLNDCGRELMASLRTWYQDAEWIDWGHTPTRVSDTQFSVPTDQTAVYTVGRRVRIVGATTGYGSISASSYGAPNTTVTVTWDSGTTPTSPTTVSAGIIKSSSSSYVIAPASTTVSGIIEIATEAEVITGTDTSRAVTADGLTTFGSYITQNIQNGNYTLVLTDKGKQIYKASGGAGETITIPANASVAFAVGTIVEIINDGGGDLSIAITTDTMTELLTGNTGTRTLPTNNKAVIQKVTSTAWKYSATG
jgi:hypothetical protein